MNRTSDDFSKSLASGMSRRKAFMKFLGGAGALGFLGLKKAKATPKLNWPPFPPTVAGCLNWAGELYNECILCGGTYSCCFYDVMTIAYDECLIACGHQGPK